MNEGRKTVRTGGSKKEHPRPRSGSGPSTKRLSIRDALRGGQDYSEEILKGRMTRTILLLSIPTIISNVFQITYNLVDTFYVGRLGPDAIAAITLGFPFLFLIFAIGIGVSIGITSMVARLLGAGKVKSAGEIASHGIILALLMTVVMMGIGFITLEGLVRGLGASEEVKSMTWDYVSIILFGTGFVFINLACSGIIRAEGNMVVPMYALIGGTVLNIVLDPIFIYGWFGFPRLEVAGAALATVISQAAVMSIVVLYLVFGNSRVRIHLTRLKDRGMAIKAILKVGLPSTVMHVMISTGIFLWAALAAGISDESLAALGLGFRINSVAMFPALGINVAIITIVGQNVGAGQFDRVRAAVRQGVWMVAIYMVIVSIIYNIRPDFWISIFTNDSTVIEQGSLFLRIVTPATIFVSITIVISGAFQGAGNAVPPMIIMATRMIVVAAPLAYILMYPLGMGIVGLWIGIAAGNLFSAIVSIAWFSRGTWMKGHKGVGSM